MDSFTQFNIHGLGVPEVQHLDELTELMASFASKEAYDAMDVIERDDKFDVNANHASKVRMRSISMRSRMFIIPVLRKCFPTLMFRISGHFVYGPGDFIGEHTNLLDPSKVLYLTYATGDSGFDYRYDVNDEFTKTKDLQNGITLRAFELTDKSPYTYHKAYCNDGYRVSIGLRYEDTLSEV
jgi:hypothetical protein